MRFVLEKCFSHATACFGSFGFFRKGGREQRASSEKVAYANLTNRLTREIHVVVGHSTPANRAFERLSPNPFLLTTVCVIGTLCD